MALISARRCAGCNTHYEVMEHKGELIGMGDTDQTTCPTCDMEEYVSVLTIPVAIELGDEGGHGKIYPYFDRALNMRISNAAQRKRVMKEKGLVEMGPDEDFERAAKRTHEVRLAKIKKMKDQNKMYDEHPDFREYRILKDKGFYDQTRDDMRERMRRRHEKTGI